MTSVLDLDLPVIDVLTLDRDAVLEAFDQARSQHWLARTPLGYAVISHSHATCKGLVGAIHVTSAPGSSR